MFWWGHNMDAFFAAFFFIAGPIYFVPTIIALANKRGQSLGIFLLNLLLGWTLLGWVGALVWACVKDKPGSRSGSAPSGGAGGSDYFGKYKGYPYRYLEEGRIEFMTASGPRTASSWAVFAEAIDAATSGAAKR